MRLVHNRIAIRHPELSDADVISAWTNAYCSKWRNSDSGMRYIAVGHDANGREIWMVAVALQDDWLIYHAMTPPSEKTREELGLGGGR